MISSNDKARRFKVLVNDVVKGSYFNLAVAYSRALNEQAKNDFARIVITDVVTHNRLMMYNL